MDESGRVIPEVEAVTLGIAYLWGWLSADGVDWGADGLLVVRTVLVAVSEQVLL